MMNSSALRSIASATSSDRELQIKAWVSLFEAGLTEIVAMPQGR